MIEQERIVSSYYSLLMLLLLLCVLLLILGYAVIYSREVCMWDIVLFLEIFDYCIPPILDVILIQPIVAWSLWLYYGVATAAATGDYSSHNLALLAYYCLLRSILLRYSHRVRGGWVSSKRNSLYLAWLLRWERDCSPPSLRIATLLPSILSSSSPISCLLEKM